MKTVNEIAALAKEAAVKMQSIAAEIKNTALEAMAGALRDNLTAILDANKKDLAAAQTELDAGRISKSMYKRLVIDEIKIEGMALGLESICSLEDPCGKIIDKIELDKGLILSQVSCPIGLLGIIFESRPDVVPQVMGLSLKSGNAVVFKGGKEAVYSNRSLFDVLYKAGIDKGLPRSFAGLVETREDVSGMLKLDDLFDLLIPRGSNELVRTIMDNTRIPVLGHADGVCSLYIDEEADLEKALDIMIDAKTQYPAVCNAIENLLVSEKILADFLPPAVKGFST